MADETTEPLHSRGEEKSSGKERYIAEQKEEKSTQELAAWAAKGWIEYGEEQRKSQKAVALRSPESDVASVAV